MRPPPAAHTNQGQAKYRSSTRPPPGPDLLTGVNPAAGQPPPYGSVGVDINCAAIGYTAQAPTANLAAPVPGSSPAAIGTASTTEDLRILTPAPRSGSLLARR